MSATMDYYLIQLMSEPYTPQEETMYNRKIGTASLIVVKSQYMNCMQDNTKWYWGKIKWKNIIVPAGTILHPCLDVTTVTKV